MILYKDGCPASAVPVTGSGERTGEWAACDQWHKCAATQIKEMRPALLMSRRMSEYLRPSGSGLSPSQWKSGLRRTLARLASSNTTEVVIGNPAPPTNANSQCLDRNVRDIQACSGPPGGRSSTTERTGWPRALLALAT